MGRAADHLLFGRERDAAFLRGFVETAATDGGALLLTGDAGVGKTALLNTVATQARRRGVRVLRASGAEYEASLSFAGVNQLLQPVLALVDELDGPDQVALRLALGVGEGHASEQLAVANAVLRLLAAAAEQEPLLARLSRSNGTGERQSRGPKAAG
jgi:ABC-type lipoprotein export system ATPase subunit